jgi:hypothetical protein
MNKDNISQHTGGPRWKDSLRRGGGGLEHKLLIESAVKNFCQVTCHNSEKNIYKYTHLA